MPRRSHLLVVALMLPTMMPIPIAADDVPPSEKTESPTITRIFVIPEGHNGWFLEFFPDGSVTAQYGSGPSDNGSMPAGTVDFDALVNAVQRLRIDERDSPGTQVALHDGTEAGSRAFFIKDDTLFRYLVDSFEGNWRSGFGALHADADEAIEPNPRFLELLESHPIFSDDLLDEIAGDE